MPSHLCFSRTKKSRPFASDQDFICFSTDHQSEMLLIVCLKGGRWGFAVNTASIQPAVSDTAAYFAVPFCSHWVISAAPSLMISLMFNVVFSSTSPPQDLIL